MCSLIALVRLDASACNEQSWGQTNAIQTPINQANLRLAQMQQVEGNKVKHFRLICNIILAGYTACQGFEKIGEEMP